MIIKPVASRIPIELSNKITKYEFDYIHIKNTKLIPNINKLLKILPTNGIVTEIRVDEGDFSESIPKINKPKKLCLIDIWGK